MAGSGEDRRHRRWPGAGYGGKGSEEEGEVVSGGGGGHHSSEDSDTSAYFNSCSPAESDETVSDDCRPAAAAAAPPNNGAPSSSAAASNGDDDDATSSPAVAAAVIIPGLELACRVCGKAFGSRKAVCGHMKVHAVDGPTPAVPGWGAAGKRGCAGSAAAGCRAVSPDAPHPDHQQPTANVDVAPNGFGVVLQPVPLAFAPPAPPPPNPTPPSSSTPMASAMTNLHSQSGGGSSSSAQPVHDDAMNSDNASVAVDPATGPAVHQPVAAPPAAGEQQPPPPPAANPHHPAAPQNPRRYTCSWCGAWFAQHQALGGHVVAHINRERAAAAARDGAAGGGGGPCRRDAGKPEKQHVCTLCDAEFHRGVQLGGHKRKHYTGPRIVPKKKQQQQCAAAEPLPLAAARVVADLALALPASADAVEPAAAVERTPEPAPTTPAPVAGRVRLFGIDIGPGAQTPEAREGSPETEGSSSTGGQQ